MAFTIEDVESRTLLQQFHALYKKQQEDEETIQNLDGDIQQEIQDRTTADEQLAEDIADLQTQLNSLGNIFTLKGSVPTVADLPASNNNVGDVWYVVSESTGYIWIDDNGTERWEQLGITVDLSNYVTQSDLTTELAGKQDNLTAGTNISIIGDTISATQPDTTKFEMLSGVSAPSTATAGAVGQKYLDTTKNDVYVCTAKTDNGDDTFSYTWLLLGGNGKQNKLTAGTNISISGDVISASGGLSEVKASDVDSETATNGQVLMADGNGDASWGNVPTPSNVMTLTNEEQEFSSSKTFFLKNLGQNNLKFRASGNGPYVAIDRGFGIYIYNDGNHDLKISYDSVNAKFMITEKRITTKTFYLSDVGGTLATISDINTKINAKVPDAPDTDGTYTLKCVVSDGGTTKTYQWVLDV